MNIKKWFSNNVTARKLINPLESKLSYVQLFGFGLISTGIIYFLFALFQFTKTTGESVSIAFFITMLGVSFGFPDLLRGRLKDMSTMRIVVFMVVNVVCMLLLKIGWLANDLEQIKLDQYWVAVLAFLFGAKAAQTYFESKMAVPGTTPTSPLLSDADYVNIAIDQNKNYLYGKGNIRLITLGKRLDASGRLIDCMTIHLKDDNTTEIPKSFEVKPNGAPSKIIETEIIPEVDKPTIACEAGDSIALSGITFKGSIAAQLKLSDGTHCALTCSHVMTEGKPTNHNGPFTPTQKADINAVQNGDWFYALRDEEFDIALIKNFNPLQVSFPGGIQVKQFRNISSDDIKTTPITMFGRKDFYGNEKAIGGFIINHQSINPISIGYIGGDYSLLNLMLLSKKKSPPYEALSRPGDSGSLVVDSNNIAIGMVVAQNSKFTYAISFSRILKKLVADIN